MLACILLAPASAEGLIPRLFAVSPWVEHVRDAGEAATTARRRRAHGQNRAARVSIAAAGAPDAPRAGHDVVFLDVRGTSKLHGGVSGLFAAIEAALSPDAPHGLGLAGNRFTAEVAALAGAGRPVVVARGDEAAFLAGQPLSVLPMSPALRKRFEPLGFATLGDVAALPVEAVERRYGPEGVAIHRLARGEDGAVLSPVDPDRRPSLHHDLPGPVDRLDRLDDALRDGLERICATLAERGQGLVRLAVHWRLEGGRRVRHEVVPAEPERRPGLLRDMVALRLEAEPPGERIVAFGLEAVDVRAEAVHQNSLFGEVERDAARRAEALSRLEALLGDGVVAAPRLRAEHRVEERWVDARATPTSGRDVPAAPRETGPALRTLPEPEELVPVVSGGQLLAFRRGRRSLDVARLVGLRRLEGGWWSGRPWARDEYDLFTPDGGWYRICRDMHRRRWLLLAEAD